MPGFSDDEPQYFSDALGENEMRAASQDLKVDSAATAALETMLASALDKAQAQEGLVSMTSSGIASSFKSPSPCSPSKRQKRRVRTTSS